MVDLGLCLKVTQHYQTYLNWLVNLFKFSSGQVPLQNWPYSFTYQTTMYHITESHNIYLKSYMQEHDTLCCWYQK